MFTFCIQSGLREITRKKFNTICLVGFFRKNFCKITKYKKKALSIQSVYSMYLIRYLNKASTITTWIIMTFLHYQWWESMDPFFHHFFNTSTTEFIGWSKVINLGTVKNKHHSSNREHYRNMASRQFDMKIRPVYESERVFGDISCWVVKRLIFYYMVNLSWKPVTTSYNITRIKWKEI